MVTFPGTAFSSSKSIEKWISLCLKNGISCWNKDTINKLIENDVAALERYINDRGCFLVFNETHYILSHSPVVRRKPGF